MTEQEASGVRESQGVYEHDPHAAADDAYEPGTVRHLVPANRGRMLDARRTPVKVLGVDEARGFFEVVVEAFEDTGARWQLPIEDVSGFQFELGSVVLAETEAQRLQARAGELNRHLEVPVSTEARAHTLREIERERRRVRAHLAGDPELSAVDLTECVASRRGADAAIDALRRLVDERGLASLESCFAETYVSNPNSGEVVKGHSIVIAEMGLCPYTGRAVREEALFDGDGARERRRAHVLLRLAFLQELMCLLGITSVELYRGIATDRPMHAPRPAPLVAATFSRRVAMSHFESNTRVGVLQRQRVPPSRLFMTFLETPAMSEPYKEAEAVLIGDPRNPLF